MKYVQNISESKIYSENTQHLRFALSSIFKEPEELSLYLM